MEGWGGDLDTIQPRRCGCVPQLSLVYDERSRGGGGGVSIGDEGWEEVGAGESPPEREGWARKIPLLGPFWCVRGSATTTIRRRDNAVYRSNSFKFERRAPEEPKTAIVPTASRVPPVKRGTHAKKQDAETQGTPQAHPRPPARSRMRHRELMLNLNYSDPQDAESDGPGWGNVNQAYEGEELQEPCEAPLAKSGVEGGGGYRLKFGQEIYYCKPYRPFHTQLRYNFSDLLESGVDSEYEEMASQRRGEPAQGPGQCSQCVTVINVRSSPGHTLQQRQANELGEPPYENLSFHKVTIAVPDVGDDANGQPHHHLVGEKPRVLLRKPPLKKSKVPLKYQGIKRVKSKSRTAALGGSREGGYSQKEVWNWLYLEEEGVVGDGEEGEEEGAPERGVSVQFSPAEFLQATNRLAHLNLEGFERFVGSTIDRALAGARTKSSDPLESREVADEQSEEAVYLQHEVEHDTDMYVSKEADVRRTSCGDCKSKVRPVCESCLRSGESSCSSALSSLESVKSSQGSAGVPRSRESDSSARGSYLSSDSPADLPPPNNPSHPARQEYMSLINSSTRAHEEAVGSKTRAHDEGLTVSSNMRGGDQTATSMSARVHEEYMRMTPSANGQSYVRLASGGQRIYRGRVRASLPLATSHKPYQTLEVNQQQEKTMSRGGTAGTPCLVDPGIALHQQEWYHGNVSRIEAETALRLHPAGSYLIRNCESARKDYSLSLKSSHGYMHMRIQLTPSGHYILGQFSRPFASIADMVNYYTVNRLPIKGAEHVSLKAPLCEQLL